MKTDVKRNHGLLAAALSCAVAVACGTAAADALNSDLSSAVVDAATTTGALLCAPGQAQLDACAGKAAADACTFTPTGAPAAVTGTCRATVDNSSIGCVPNPPAPPAELVDACTSHAAGDACSFTGHHGETETGVCATARDSTTLICAHHARTPPQGAIDACAGLTAGAACALPSHGDGGTTEAGSCSLGPTGAGPLACEHPHGVGVEATAACAGLASGAACTISHHDESATGTCVTPASGGDAVCLVACGALGGPHGPGGPGGHGGPGHGGHH